MPHIVLLEYHNVSGTTYSQSGNSFTFDPDPKSIKKHVEVKWRVRRAGMEKKIERVRFRYNEKMEFTLTGSCSETKRDELEWYAKRDSLFRLDNCTMRTYHSEETEDQGPGTPNNWAAAQSQGEETVYVVIEKAEFNQKEGKTDWYDYSLELRRCHLTRH